MSATRRPSTAASAALAFAVVISVPLVLGFFKDLHPAFDSLAHFRVHLAAMLVFAAILLLFGPLRPEGLAALALGAASFMTALGISPSDLLNAEAETPPPPGARYRLLQLNLRFDNKTPERALSVIARSQPDVITLNEVSAMWRGKLALLDKAYPYRIVCDPPTPIGGVAILSRRPFADGTSPSCHDRGSLAVARIDFGGQKVDLAALHLGWPWPFEQAAQVARIGDVLGTLGETALLAGDFNAASWSATTAHIAAAGGLRLIKGVRPSWLPSTFPDAVRRIAGLPIDQLMAKGPVIVRAADTLDGSGSDHMAVLLEFSLAPGPKPEPAILQAAVAQEGI